MIAVRAQDLDESERAMGNGISLIALPQWYRDWGLKYGKRGYALHALCTHCVPCVMLIAVA